MVLKPERKKEPAKRAGQKNKISAGVAVGRAICRRSRGDTLHYFFKKAVKCVFTRCAIIITP